MRQNPLDHRRVFNTGDDLDLTGTVLAGLNIDTPTPDQTPDHAKNRRAEAGVSTHEQMIEDARAKAG